MVIDGKFNKYDVKWAYFRGFMKEEQLIDYKWMVAPHSWNS